MTYKIIFHEGASIDIKTKGDSGLALLSEDALIVESSRQIAIRFSEMKSVEMFRHYGMARMIKIVHLNNTLFLTVVRFNFYGYFASVNFLKTGELYNLLKTNAAKSSPSPATLK